MGYSLGVDFFFTQTNFAFRTNTKYLVAMMHRLKMMFLANIILQRFKVWPEEFNYLFAFNANQMIMVLILADGFVKGMHFSKGILAHQSALEQEI